MSTEEKTEKKVEEQEQEIKNKAENEAGNEKNDDDDSDDNEGEGQYDQGTGEEKDSKKSSRGEKKFKKAMVRLGMKTVPGITRVTLKKAKQFLLYIDEPEVMKSPGTDNSYIIFGEAKIHDFPGSIGKDELGKFQKPEKAEDQLNSLTQNADQPKLEAQKEGGAEGEAEDEGGEVDMTGITEENLKMVMEHSKVSKQKAAKALREANNDFVNAIMKFDEN